MAADVSSLHRVLSGYRDDLTARNDSGAAKSTAALFTRDLLGGGGSDAASMSVKNESQELDLDLQVPTGWEKRLDLKSGKVYLQKCNSQQSTLSAASSDGKIPTNQIVPKFHDLNFPPSPRKPLHNLFDESSLELKLDSSASSSAINYQSVCTLDKVKSALERAEKEPVVRKRSTTTTSLWRSSPSYSTSSSSIKDIPDDANEAKFSSPVAVGCPGCLSYVLIMKNDPKCPRCNSVVLVPAMKKPRIDLNMSI
ncbi:hypothetical protein SLA2020_142950 [Shorea laevis]